MTKKLSLIIDIESGLVRGILVAYGQGDLKQQKKSAHPIIPEIVYTTQTDIGAIQSEADHTSEHFFPMMLNALKQVVDTVSTKGLPTLQALHGKGVPTSISDIHFVLSAPWAISKTKTVNIMYSKDTEITRESISTIIESERKSLEEKFKAERGTAPASDFDITCIEQKVFEIKLNGYPVLTFQGKKARELDVSFAITLSSASIINSIQEQVAQSLHIKKDQYHSSLLLQYTAFRSHVHQTAAQNDYAILHIHDEISDIMFVKNNICSWMASIPFGLSTFIRKSLAALGQSEEVTHSTLALLANNKLDNDQNQATAETVSRIVGEWAQAFFQVLNVADEMTYMPRHLFISLRNHFSYFEKALRSHLEERAALQAGSKTELVGNYEIKEIEDSLFNNSVTYARAEDRNAIVSMYAVALNPFERSDI